MGFISSGNIIVIITGKDKQTGQVIYQTSMDKVGSIIGQSFDVGETIEKLSELYPNLEWEYEMWKE